MERESVPGPGSPEWEELRTKAVELRRDGRTRREIGEILGIRNTDLLSDLLRDEPRVLGGKWPDVVKRERARMLRRFGYSQYEICRVLETSRSSVSRWVRDMPWETEVLEPGTHGDVEWEELREQARGLRREGWSLASIAEHLELPKKDDVERMCRGIRLSTVQGTRKPLLRESARQMRREGRTIPEIERELGIARSTASLWVRNLPRPAQVLTEEQHAVRSRRNRAAIERAYFGPRRQRRERERQATKDAAASEIGTLSDRELFLVGVALYWAEGAKDKWYARREHFQITNSDPDVIRIVMAWLGLLGVTQEAIGYRVSIHEDADLGSAEDFWAKLVGAPRSAFSKASLKKTNSRTKRLNRGDGYRGCLVVTVRQSAGLYQRIEGSWQGVAAAVAASSHVV